jgi:hypothetical protein
MFLLYRTEKQNDNVNGFTSTLALFRKLLPVAASASDTSQSCLSDSTGGSAGPPDVVYLLVPGHFSGSADLKQLWGGDMDLELDDDEREGVGAGDSIRFTCRSVKSTTESEDTATTSNSADNLKRTSSTVSDGCNNIHRGWWRELAVNDGLKVKETATGGEPYVVRWDTVELSRLYKAQQSFLLEKSVTVAVEEVRINILLGDEALI